MKRLYVVQKDAILLKGGTVRGGKRAWGRSVAIRLKPQAGDCMKRPGEKEREHTSFSTVDSISLEAFRRGRKSGGWGVRSPGKVNLALGPPHWI